MEAEPLMIILIRSAAFALLLVPTMAAAQDFDKGVAAFLADDFATAIFELTPLAEQGSEKAQVVVGLMYKEGGQGVPQDYAEALKFFRLAAEQGISAAQVGLGEMYALGQGVTQDFVAAHMWYNLASANGENEAGSTRDKLALLMLPADISKAQQRAKVCMESNYQDCD
jgi:uncharacterized protein